MRKQLAGAVLAGLAGSLIASPPAAAQTPAFTNTTVNLFAGPAGDYPIVAQVPGGVPVSVWGCLAGFSWCDISLSGLRGWVWGGFLNYTFQGRPVPVMSYGPMIGLPVVTFSLGAYWGNFYRDRPWFRNQAHWMRRPPPRPVRPPPIRPPHRPPGVGGRPPQGGGPGNNARPPGGGRPSGGGRPPGAGRPSGGQGSGAQAPGPGRPPGAGGGGRPPGTQAGQGGGRPQGQGGGRRPPDAGGGNRSSGGGRNRQPGGGN
ncbi:MAG: peptide-binding protein [Paraburkholderia sp.]|uniref:SH3 domain-containing protein n=1 Tax=Paraburkholderia sp. TaxID=1926495 RepID=UPI00122B7E80|nr:SH3 domain-containing protein [Paraburkholderia sp.]TAM00232.1 MAG: peptide-binding protein [Paraburkholderia sp.]TAM30927.1 MAG: peptide-binding protein [Paraburkholderia sp.]